MITVRKLKLIIINEGKSKEIINDKFIIDTQYKWLNLAMNILTSAYLLSDRDIKSDIFKDA